MVVQPQLLSLSAYIDQNLDKDLPLSSLAKRVGLSPFHFHRKFGAYFGESLHQHIKRLRLERAAFELTHSSRPVAQIALSSGYKTVSAFSHAFSGFAGQSPTRYRNRSAVNGSVPGAAAAPLEAAGDATDAMRPTWIGELAPQPFAFVRAMGHGSGAQPSVREAFDTIVKIVQANREVEPVASHGMRHGMTEGRAATSDVTSHPSPESMRAVEFIVATTDFFGIVNGGDFRIDVGLDAGRVSNREEVLGTQMLPGGRYARFDIVCIPDELIGRCYRAAMRGLRGGSENTRTSSHFVRFIPSEPGAESAPRSYRFFIPLTG